MPGNIEHLREQLARATDQIEKLDLMIELARETERSDPAGARKIAMKALRMARTRKDPLRMAQSTTILGFCEHYLTNYPGALEWFGKAMKLPGDPLTIARIHHGRREYDRAMEYYNSALEGVHVQGDRHSEQQILMYLSECFEAMGDVAEAYRHYQLHTRLKEEVVGQQQQHEMMQFRIRMEIERAEKDREILRLEKQSLEREMEHKLKELTSTALHVVEKNEFLDSLKREISAVVRVVDGKVRPALRGLMRQVDARINDVEEWDAFEKQFELVHHDFIRSLSRHCPALTKTELRVCALLKLDFSTKDIAGILSISFRTIEFHRRNIRQKLAIPLPTKFATYLAAF